MDILGFKPRVLNILEVSPLCCKILNSRVLASQKGVHLELQLWMSCSSCTLILKCGD
jgi:hypothetical protein